MGWGIPFGIYSQDAKPDPSAQAAAGLGLGTAATAGFDLTGQNDSGIYRQRNPTQSPGAAGGAPGYTAQQLAGMGINSQDVLALNPLMNKQLQQATGVSGQAASGALGNMLGGRANLANAAGTQAAQAIGGAGLDTRGQTLGALGAAGGQNQQMGQDLNVVRNTANGVGPSVAENLAKAQLAQTQQAMAGQAATARGGNIAAAMRAAQQQGGQMGLAAAPQLQAQRANEQLNAQGILGSTNAALGQNLNTTANAYGTQRAQDVTQATDQAASLNDASKVASANFGTQAGLVGQGMSGLQSAAALQQSSAVQQQTAEENARQQYIDFLQKQYSLGAGLPVSFAGPAAQIAVANQNAQTQTNGASSAALGALLAAAV